MTDTLSRSRARFARAALAFGLAVALAACSAHWYATPALSGAPEHPLWIERDVLFSLASSAVALGIVWRTRGSATRPGAIAAGSIALRSLLWLGFTVLFLAIWAHYLFLLTLLIAPTHALAALRLLASWTSLRAEDRLNQRS